MEMRRCLALLLLEILGTMYSQYYVLADKDELLFYKDDTNDELLPVFDDIPDHICRTPLTPKNGELVCGRIENPKDRYVCKSTCEEGFEFPNKQKKGKIFCNLITNEWDPREKFPDCVVEMFCKPDCKNGGICTNTNVCTCPPRYEGTACEKDKCKNITPPSNGKISCKESEEKPDRYVCEAECNPYFQLSRGRQKESFSCNLKNGEWQPRLEVLECERVCDPPCQNGGTCLARNKCFCTANFNGDRCEYGMCHPGCQNGGVCVEKDKCACHPNFEGRWCEKAICNPRCQNGGRCMAGNFCNCPASFAGRTCEETICNPPCQNGGKCLAGNICNCPALFTGGRCSEKKCMPPCQNGGTCMPGNTCNCRQSFMGRRCELNMCDPGCQNGGICVEKDKCACHPDFEGFLCEKAKRGKEICNPPCRNGGTCMAGNVCNCPEYFIGRICQETNCNPPCENGGICLAGDVCVCAAPFTGRRCEEITKCIPPCQNGGTCMARNICNCPESFTGRSCEKGKCNPPCQNGGTCVDGNICYCPESFTGRTCEKAICNPPCENGGQCLAGNVCNFQAASVGGKGNETKCNPPCQNGGICAAGDVCYCLVPFTGRRCEETICNPPCQNGGKCLAGNVCKCSAPFTGGRCNEIKCNPPCQHGGICAAGNICYCRVPFTGIRCEETICNPPCQNGGTCLAGNVCNCPASFAGGRCNEKICNPPCQNGRTCMNVNICNRPESIPGRLLEENFSKCGLGVENVGMSGNRIVGGQVSVEPWPWMAALYMGKEGKKKITCGGSIIHQQFILTAAHCMRDFDGRKRDANEIIVKLGLKALQDRTYLQQFEVRKIHEHKQFRNTTINLDYDIALLELDKPIVYNAVVRPICLPEKVMPEKFYKPQELAWAIGWGDTQVVQKQTIVNPIISQVLKEIPLPIPSRETCVKSLKDDDYDDHFTKRMFCAGSGEERNDACRGDSGGPIMQSLLTDEGYTQWTQVGIISWGLGCGLKDEYSFHTHLQELLPWVQENIEEALK